MQKLKDLDDFDFDIDEYLPSNTSTSKLPQVDPLKVSLAKQESALDSMEEELFGKPLIRPSFTQPAKDPSSSSILASYQQPSSMSVVPQSQPESQASFSLPSKSGDSQSAQLDSNLPSFLKRDSNTRRKKRGEDKSSFFLSSQQSTVLPALKEVSGPNSQVQSHVSLSIMSHEDKVQQWAKWLKIKSDESQLMQYAQKGAQLPLPYPWKEQDGMYVNNQSGKRQDRHPLWADILEEVEEKRRPIKEDVTVHEDKPPSHDPNILIVEQPRQEFAQPVEASRAEIRKPGKVELVQAMTHEVVPTIDLTALARKFELWTTQIMEQMQNVILTKFNDQNEVLSDITDRIDSIVEENQKYQTVLQHINETHNKISETIGSLSKAAHEFQGFNQKLETAISKTETTNEFGQKVFHDLQQFKTSTQESLKTEFNTQKIVIEKIRTDLTTRTSQMSEKENQFVSTVQKYLMDLQIVSNSQKTSLELFQTERDKSEQRVSSLLTNLSRLQNQLETQKSEWAFQKDHQSKSIAEERSDLEQERLKIKENRKSLILAIDREQKQWKDQQRQIEGDIQKMLSKQRELDADLVDKKIALERIRSEILANQQEVSSFQTLRRALTDQESEIRRMHETAIRERISAQKSMDEVNIARAEIAAAKESLAKEKRRVGDDKAKIEHIRTQVSRDIKTLSEKRILFSSSYHGYIPTGDKENRGRSKSPKKKFGVKTSVPDYPKLDTSVLKNETSAVDLVTKTVENNWALNDQNEFLQKVSLQTMLLPQHQKKLEK